MTGAPKLRSVQLLDELESQRRRWIYSGRSCLVRARGRLIVHGRSMRRSRRILVRCSGKEDHVMVLWINEGIVMFLAVVVLVKASLA